MKHWMWPRKLRFKKKIPGGRRVVRKRRPHKTARERLREFGLSRFRYLAFVPVLIVMIVLVANLRVPRASTVSLMLPVPPLQAEQQGDIVLASAKWRAAIPAGYRLAVELAFDSAVPISPEMTVWLSLSGTGQIHRQAMSIGEGALPEGASVVRAEIDIPYGVSGRYALALQVLDAGGRSVSAAELGELRVY
jgi:hypothetical protein